MIIVVPDQPVEYHRVKQVPQVEHWRAGDIPNQVEALLQGGAAFLLVFVLGYDAERLAEILLVQAFDDLNTVQTGALIAIVSLNLQLFQSVHAPDFYRSSGQT